MINLIKYYWCKWFHKKYHVAVAILNPLRSGLTGIETYECTKPCCTAKQMVWL